MNSKDESAIAQFLRSIQEGTESIIDIDCATDKDGTVKKRISFGRRAMQPEPKQFPTICPRSPRRHEFYDVRSFGTYIARQANGESVPLVLACPSERTIYAVLSEDAERMEEVITCRPMVHPLFEPWNNLIGKAIEVRDFANFVMENRRAVVHPDGLELATMFSQVKMSKSITRKIGTGKRAINAIIIELDIASQKTDVAIDLPDSIEISVPLLVNTEDKPLELDLLVTESKDGDSLMVRCTASQILSAMNGLFAEMVDQMQNEFPELLVGMGRIEYGIWDTV